MHILIASLYLPYPTVPHGGGHDLFRAIETLSQRHTISVVSFADTDQASHVDALRPYVTDVQLVIPAVTVRHKLSNAMMVFAAKRLEKLGPPGRS